MSTVTLHRHRLPNFLTSESSWSLWHTKDHPSSHMETQTKTFEVSTLERFGSSKEFGDLYKELSHADS